MALHWATVANLVGATGATGPTGPTGPTGATTSYRTTFSSFTVPAVGSTVAVTVAATADFVVGQYHLLTDGTLYALMTVTSIASLVVTYTNQTTPGGAVSGTMGAGRLYMVSHVSALATATVAGLMPPYDNATIGITGGKVAVLAIPESAVTNLSTDLTAKALKTTTITAGDGMSGGGDLSANRTLAVDATVLRNANILAVNLGSVTTTQTVDCTGAISVAIVLVINTVGVTLNLTHLQFGVMVNITVANTSSTNARNFIMAATQPNNTAYSSIVWKLSTGPVAVSTLISVPAATSLIAQGAGNANGQMQMVAN